MSFMEVFDPGMRHWREYKELQKVLVQRTDQGASGPEPVDLDSGVIIVHLPAADSGHPPHASRDADADTARDE